jgi:chemotaxis protein methyltransferase CheR
MSDFIRLKTAIEEISGISIEAAKDYLIESRLSPVLKKHQIDDFKTLEKLLVNEPPNGLVQDVVDQIVTPETRFFRDEKMFKTLEKELFPDLFSGAKPISLLSAGSSTGQEAYSLAMLIKESLPYYFNSVSIDAVDISKKSIDKARLGTYSDFEINRGLEPSFREKFFEGQDGSFKIVPQIKAKVDFQQRNLLKDILPSVYDIVFFRNVAIYFSEANKGVAFRNLYRALKKNGILIIGSSESLQGFTELYEIFTLQGCYFYRKK